MRAQPGDDAEPKRPSLAKRAGLGVLGAAAGTVAGYFIFGDAFGMIASAVLVGLGASIGLGGDGHGGGVDGGGDGGGGD